MLTKKYSIIVFDLGNVLIPFEHNKWIERLNKVEQGLGEKYYRLYMENYNVHRSYEAGQMSDEEFINRNLKWIDYKITSNDFCEIFSNIFTVNTNVVKLLPKLKENYKLVLLSNTNNIHKKYGWEKYQFLKNFDKLILSHEIGTVKPEKKIYKAVELYTREPGEKHIFIDDIKEYVEAAKQLGWDGIQFTDYENLLQEFKKRKIL